VLPDLSEVIVAFIDLLLICLRKQVVYIFLI
jgi:hypothetical protein